MLKFVNNKILCLRNSKVFPCSKNNIIIKYNRYQNNSFTSSSKLKNNTSNNKPKAVATALDISLWEQFKYFPTGVLLLYNDFITYLNINAASQTKTNAWSKQNNNTVIQPNFLQTRLTPTIIPRRQKEQQRQFMRDIRRCLPIVGLYTCIPFIGNIFAVLAILHPYYLLSNQFYMNFEQKRYYCTLDDEQNIIAFENILEYLSKLYPDFRNEIRSMDNEVIIQSWMKFIISLQKNNKLIANHHHV